jgi:hypothetical protein
VWAAGGFAGGVWEGSPATEEGIEGWSVGTRRTDGGGGLRRAARRCSRCPRQAVRPAVEAGAPVREKKRRQTRQGRKKVSVGCSQRRLLLLRSGGASCCIGGARCGPAAVSSAVAGPAVVSSPAAWNHACEVGLLSLCGCVISSYG